MKSLGIITTMALAVVSSVAPVVAGIWIAKLVGII